MALHDFFFSPKSSECTCVDKGTTTFGWCHFFLDFCPSHPPPWFGYLGIEFTVLGTDPLLANFFILDSNEVYKSRLITCHQDDSITFHGAFDFLILGISDTLWSITRRYVILCLVVVEVGARKRPKNSKLTQCNHNYVFLASARTYTSPDEHAKHGDEALATGDFEKAIRLYTEAINGDSNNFQYVRIFSVGQLLALRTVCRNHN